MAVFIITILVLACYQSFCKLSLLSWRWIIGFAVITGNLPFFFEERIANSSMLKLNLLLTDPAVLNNWCAIIVIQELLTLLCGFSLIADQAEEYRTQRKKWHKLLQKVKYAIFLPSILLPAGVLYFQMYLFNHFPEKEFRHLTWYTATSIVVAMFIVALILKFFYRQKEKHILGVLHAEFILLLPAIFLPVAAHAKLIPANEVFDFRQPLLLLLLFLLLITVFTIFFHIKNQRKGKNHVNCNPNS